MHAKKVFGGSQGEFQSPRGIKIPRPEAPENPWGRAEATEEINPETEGNPFLGQETSPTMSSTPTIESEADATGSEEVDLESRRRQASDFISGLVNPAFRILGKEPLTKDDCDNLGHPLAEFVPGWMLHPVIRFVGVASRIAAERQARVIDAGEISK